MFLKLYLWSERAFKKSFGNLKQKINHWDYNVTLQLFLYEYGVLFPTKRLLKMWISGTYSTLHFHLVQGFDSLESDSKWNHFSMELYFT